MKHKPPMQNTLKLLLIVFLGSCFYGSQYRKFLQTDKIGQIKLEDTILPPSVEDTIEGDERGDGQKPRNHQLAPLSRMPQNPQEVLQLLQEARQQEGQRATFLQIGANNGEMFDPLYPHFKDNLEQKKKWIGLLVEPQPQLYGSLAVLHADAPDWAFYLGAVASPNFCINGRIQFCETKTPGQGNWTTQGQVNKIATSCDLRTMHFQQRPCVTSFDDLIYQNSSPAFLQYTMQTKISKNGQYHSLERTYNIDLLQIDAEGKDYDILSLIDWKQLHPTCIAYEHRHLGEKKQAAEDLLKQMGYATKERKMDVLACRIEIKVASSNE